MKRISSVNRWFRSMPALVIVAGGLLASLPAEAIELFVWRGGSAPVILAGRDGESGADAMTRYVRAFQQDADLSRLLNGASIRMEQTLDPSVGTISKLGDQDIETRGLLLANRVRDLLPGDWRVPTFTKFFDRAGRSSYVLPVAADVGLTEEEAVEFREEISNRFALVIAMGGADVDPAMYNETNRFSLDFNGRRDLSEIRLIQHYTSAKKGFLLGVCRGSQLTSIALGYKMVQDIPKEVGTGVTHADGAFHDIHLLYTTTGWLSRILGGAKTAYVNSYHHQAVIYRNDGPLQIAARSADGVTEATESKDGRILLLQFHPELMDRGTKVDAALGERIMFGVMKAADYIRTSTSNAPSKKAM